MARDPDPRKEWVVSLQRRDRAVPVSARVQVAVSWDDCHCQLTLTGTQQAGRTVLLPATALQFPSEAPLARPTRKLPGKGQVRLTESQTQHHRAEHRRADGGLRESFL